MSLQNYAMNFETHLTNRDEYNYQKLETVSEKVFWHWAMHIGILNPTDISNSSTGNQDVYIEKGYDDDKEIADIIPERTVIRNIKSSAFDEAILLISILIIILSSKEDHLKRDSGEFCK